MTAALPQAFGLDTTYVQLTDGPAAVPVPVDAEFWPRLAERTALHDGRLVALTRQTADWSHWEMHPAGDEVVYLLSGGVEMVFELAEGSRNISLQHGAGLIVPQGIWHRALVHQAGDMLFITRGAGTRHRPI